MLVSILGVLGFFLAVISLTWEIWRYRNDQKETLHLCQPGYIIDPFSKGGALTVTVVNTGRAPVYIADVSLHWEDRDGSTGAGMTPIGQNAMADPREDVRVEPGQGMQYALRGVTDNDIDEALLSRTWVSVSSHKGELARMEEVSVRWILNHLQDTRKSLVGL